MEEQKHRAIRDAQYQLRNVARNDLVSKNRIMCTLLRALTQDMPQDEQEVELVIELFTDNDL